MSSDIAIRVRSVSKHYLMFERPEDRLKQMIMPRLQRFSRRAPRSYYREFAALKSVSFDVKRGETVGIIGRNGCGKSTLLQIVCGTLQPTAGAIEVNGRIAALLELGAGFNPEFTGRENVYLNGAILGLSRAEIDTRFDRIAAFADIGMFIEHPVKTYSSGMYVRLAFAVAINVDPDILVVDEALSVGDEAFQRKCFARIEDIKDKGGTILFVSHGAQTIVQLCDRAILIDGGEVLLDGRPKMLVSQYQRLVNASAEGAPTIRASIQRMRDAPPQPMVAAPVASLEVARVPELVGADAGGIGNGAALPSPVRDDGMWAGAVAAPQPPRDEGHADYFDSNLTSQSTVYLEEHSARIRDVHVTTLDGKPVNVLRMGKRYVLGYIVEFHTDATSVAFGMAIRTVTGLVVAGATNCDIPSMRLNIKAGRQLRINFEFDCSMLPGTYFFGCAVYGVNDRSADLLQRVVDAVLVRVASEGSLLAKGFFDIFPRLSTDEISNDFC